MVYFKYNFTVVYLVTGGSTGAPAGEVCTGQTLYEYGHAVGAVHSYPP